MTKRKQLLISVVIPTWGRDQVLIDTIKQVLQQTFDGFELLVVDQSDTHDQSTQAFLDTCDDPRYRYFKISPPSLTAARNFAATKAQADIILYLDDDIVIEPDFIQAHYDAFTQDPEIVAVGGRVINKTNTQELVHQPLRFDKWALSRGTFNCDTSQFAQSFPGGNMSVRAATLRKIGGFDTSYHGAAVREESDTAYRLSKYGKIYFSAEAAILHLAAPVGGTRIHTHYFDNLQFYTTDLLFALKSVRLQNLPIAVALRYVHAIRGQRPSGTMRRSSLFARGLLRAVRYRLRPLKVVARETPANFSIAIDARPFTGGYNGYTTYLTSVIEPLLDANWRVILLTNQALNPVHTFIPHCKVVILGPTASLSWEQWAVPKFLRGNPVDLYFAGVNHGIPARRIPGVRYILGFLDVIPYKFPRQYAVVGKGYYIRKELAAQLISVARAHSLITISQQSARDIRAYFHRHATPLLIRLRQIKRPKVSPQRQFVYIGGVTPRKRVDMLLQAFAQFYASHPDFSLVLIGSGYEVYDRQIEDLHINEAVKRPGFVSDAVKARLIAESTAMVYPSEYEGYGLAIAEGFQAGIPVIAGEGGAQKEIGGNAIQVIDPKDPVSIAAAMEAVLDPTVAKKLVAAGEKRLAELSDPEVSQAIIEYFTQQALLARESL